MERTVSRKLLKGTISAPPKLRSRPITASTASSSCAQLHESLIAAMCSLSVSAAAIVVMARFSDRSGLRRVIRASLSSKPQRRSHLRSLRGEAGGFGGMPVLLGELGQAIQRKRVFINDQGCNFVFGNYIAQYTAKIELRVRRGSCVWLRINPQGQPLRVGEKALRDIIFLLSGVAPCEIDGTARRKVAGDKLLHHVEVERRCLLRIDLLAVYPAPLQVTERASDLF